MRSIHATTLAFYGQNELFGIDKQTKNSVYRDVTSCRYFIATEAHITIYVHTYTRTQTDNFRYGHHDIDYYYANDI